MATPKTTRPPAAAESPPPAASPGNDSRGPRHPEKKIGPFAGGVGVAIWLNQVDTADGGSFQRRSVTINPRRYYDRETNQWKDASSYTPADLPALIFSLQRALEFVFETPLPGESPTGEREEVPF